MDRRKRLGDQLLIRPLLGADVRELSKAFAAIGWSKPEAIYERYLEEQEAGIRWVRVAEWKGEIAGYVTLLWRSEDPVLREADIPEVVDLNVLPKYQRRGIGSALLDEAETQAATRGQRVGLRVGLHSGYGAAQRLYVRRGYLPDGSGAVVKGVPVREGSTIRLDDEVTIRFTKDLVL